VLNEIEQSAAAGKLIVTHRDPVQVLQWRGVGFIVLDPVTGAAGYLITGGIAGSTGTAGGATAENSDNMRSMEDALNLLRYDGFTGNRTNATSVEGLLLTAGREVEITEQQTTIFEGRGRSIQSLSACGLGTVANAEGSAVVNNVLWNNIFGSPLGVPSAKTHVPSLSAFVFDFYQQKLKELREQGISCQ
jgi:hypothetical protein